MNILEKIMINKKIEVEKDKIMNPIELLKSKTLNKNNSFSKALIEFKKKNSTAIIAEIKKASPSKGILKNDFNHIDIAEEFYNNNAACLSVLTEKKYFHGDKSFVNDIKKKFDIPILNKDFFIDTYQIYEANKNGADCILIILNSSKKDLINDLICTAKRLGMDFILEIHNEKEMEIALDYNGGIIGINNRNLENFSVSINNTIRIFKEFENSIKNKILISESGFHKKEDIKKIKDHTNINNFLIGESLMKSDSISKCFKDLTE